MSVALGADGCAAGWVVVVLDDGRLRDVEVVGTLDEVLDGSHGAVGVDMPVGLLDVPRDADVAARRLLPGRAPSVFSAPPRAVVEAFVAGHVTTHAEASTLASATTGAGLSQQAWRLVPKVAEVDALVADGHPILEVHPEVAFAVVVGGPLPRKRSWSGLTTRRAVLERLGIELPDRFAGDEDAAPDDVVDAAVCAWVAAGAAAGAPLLAVPDRTDQVARGRAVVITARPGPPVRPGPRRPRSVRPA